MHGGKRIAEGEAVLVLESGNAQLIARGRQAMTSSSLIAGLPAENIDLC